WNLTYRGSLVAQFRAGNPANKLVPFVLVGGGAIQVVSTDSEGKNNPIVKDTDEMLHVGVGAKYRVDNGWGLRLDGRLLFVPAAVDSDDMPSDGFTQDYEVLLSIYKEFGRKKVEKIIEEPPPDLDPDKDGILGDADKCPTEPEDKDTFQDDDGCPDLDNDGDGIPDAADKCPLEAEDKDSFQDDDGCPDPDNDQDGVLDPQDKCPDQPETKNGFQDEDGCPDEIPAQLKKFTGVIAGINFKLNSAELLPASNKTLDKAIVVLKEFPDLRLEIQGHTDDQRLKGNAKPGSQFMDNQQLSQGRAESVKAYFVKKGLDEARFTAVGFGDSQPVVSPEGLKGGKLNAARAKNRRVEFKLVSALTTGTTPAPATPAPATPAPATPAPAQ
ncbi:MAG: OmpA family protein, partial [Deltaproteobacteria bacterium]|nr:OmpA family protein [Deltaproteobacteria bacterium]